MKKNNKKNVAVFGADGFIGLHLCKKLAEDDYLVIACVRKKITKNLRQLNHKNINIIEVGNLLKIKNIKLADKNNVSYIVNLAGKAHDTKKNDFKIYKEKHNIINIEKNIRNNFDCNKIPFIQVSSAKADDTSRKNIDNMKMSYSLLKLRSEAYVKKYFKKYIILRPPLLYGPNVKANFLALMTLVSYGIPLPLKKVKNLRNYVYVENFVDLISHIISNKKFLNKSYFVNDSDAISTFELYNLINKYLEKKPNAFYINSNFLKFIFRLLNKSNIYDKIYGDFIVNDFNLVKDLNWKPKYNFEKGIKKTCFWYKSRFK